MPIVQMPDGAMVEMPDEITPEQSAALQTQILRAKMQQAAPMEDILHKLKLVGSAGIRGAGALPAMAGSLGLAATDALGLTDGTTSPMKALSQLGEQPRTKPEGYLNSVAEGVGSALTMPFGGVGKAAIQGGLSGFGAEAAGNVFGDEGKPNILPKVLGGLAGGVTSGLVTSALPQQGNVARGLMRDVKPNEMQQAIAGMEKNIAAGTPTNLSQTMPSASNIDSGVEALANSKHGVRTTEMLRSQPGQAQLEAVAELSGLPGGINTERSIADAGQSAMTERIAQAKKARTDAVTPLYDQAGELPKEALKNIRDILAEKAMEPGTSLATIRAIQSLGRELEESAASGLPRTHAKDVKAAIDGTIREGLVNTLNPASPKTQGELKYLTKQLYDTLGDHSPQIKEANALFRKISEQSVDPLKKSIVGNIAGRGAKADVSAPQSKISAIFNKGTPEGATQSDILDFAKASVDVGQPEVYQNAVKSWFNEKLSAAFKSDTARTSETVSTKLVGSLGNPVQGGKEWNTTRDMLRGLAISEGKASDTYIGGMESLLRLNSEMAIRPGSIRGESASQLNSAAKDSWLTRMGSTSFIAPLRQPALLIARVTGAKVLRDMDKWLTTPEGAAKLAELGKQEYMSSGWVKTLQTLGATTAASQSSE